ncbi:MAG: regulatory protein RecX [Nitrospirae bacterium]|nr:regulatory protein RecX [Nitrospirota bacterium]
MRSTQDNTANEIRKYCYRLLNNRDYTKAELYKKLTARGYPTEDIEEELLRLKELGFIDDRRVARLILSHCENYRHLGAFACKEELRARGIARDIIEELTFTAERELEKGIELVNKKTAYLKKFPVYVKLNKMYELLYRHGFDSETISQVLRQYKEEEKYEDY